MTNQTEEQRRIAALEEDVAALKSQLAQVNSLQSASEAGKLSATCYIKVKLESQPKRIAELYERITGHLRPDAAFVIETGKIFIQPAAITGAAIARGIAPYVSMGKEASVKTASDAIARSMLGWAQEMAASAAETDKRLAAAKQEEENKAQVLEDRLTAIEISLASLGQFVARR